MADKIDDGGPAYPVEIEFSKDGSSKPIQTGHMTGWSSGLSVRDKFALEVAPALLTEIYRKLSDAEAVIDNVYQVTAKASYEFADAMIKARKGGL